MLTQKNAPGAKCDTILRGSTIDLIVEYQQGFVTLASLFVIARFVRHTLPLEPSFETRSLDALLRGVAIETSELFRQFDNGLGKILRMAEEPQLQDVRQKTRTKTMSKNCTIPRAFKSTDTLSPTCLSFNFFANVHAAHFW